jgi:hypothetical protein
MAVNSASNLFLRAVRGEAWWQSIFYGQCYQARDYSVANRQVGANFQQEVVHLVTELRALIGQRSLSTIVPLQNVRDN